VSTILPESLSFTGTVILEGTAPYVDTQDGDTSYAQLDGTVNRSQNTYSRLPTVTLCPNPVSVEVVIEGRWVSGTGADAEPPDDLVLVYLNSTATALGSARQTEYAHAGNHKSLSYVLESLPLTERTGRTWADMADLAAAGSLYIGVQFGAQAYLYRDFRFTYVALRWVCDLPLRNAQRDDNRGHQRTSRLLSNRNAAYL
jgi:hypothetical protein